MPLGCPPVARVLLLHQYFPPDIAITGRHGQIIASHLASRGHEVTAVVAQPSYDERAQRAPRRERVEGVSVRRVSTGPFRGRRSRFVRLAGYVLYLLGATRATLRRSPDVIITFHIPPFLPGLAIVLAKLRRARVIYVPQDIHPDILLSSGWLSLPRSLVRLWDAFNRAVLARSDVVVALGEGMRRTLIAKGAVAERTVVVSVWAEPAFAVLARDDAWRAEHGIGRDSLVVLYAGNMGVMHPLEHVLDAAARLHGEDVRIVVAGDGVRRERWEREVAARGLDRVLMLPLQSAPDFLRLVAACDVTVVALSPGMERLAVPSRPYPSLAAGRPVVAVTSPDADIARDVVAHGAGWQVDGGDELAALLLDLRAHPAAVREASAQARRLYEARFTPERATARYAELVEGLAG
jgi:glycosyltransferase involved in cell wall biosynthesis